MIGLVLRIIFSLSGWTLNKQSKFFNAENTRTIITDVRTILIEYLLPFDEFLDAHLIF